ncbi:hypothetical protein J2T11_002671 [Paenarthrobacter nicotinovorans]|nr:hypothetical protein [Paenarthrobacter nicotinovorans]
MEKELQAHMDSSEALEAALSIEEKAAMMVHQARRPAAVMPDFLVTKLTRIQARWFLYELGGNR